MTTPSLASFASRRRPVVVTEQSVVHRSYIDQERKFPLVLEPGLARPNLPSWAAAHREELDRDLTTHGAILFRGFGLKTPADFDRICAAVTGGLLEYRERSSPRSKVAGNIYTSTDYPPDKPIFLHNEQSYNLVFPRRILFFCETAPVRDGETPIADVRRVFQAIEPSIRTRFLERGYTYVRNFGHGFGLPWQTSFQTDSREEVERYCHASRISCEWRERNCLRTRQVRPVAAVHPVSGERVWFNHATFFHVSTLEPSIRELLLNTFGEDDLPNNTYYGDGSPIEPDVLDHLRAVYHAETVSFPWQEGDVLLLDNMLAAHGRARFEGARSILVGMAQPHRWDDLAVPAPEI